jgi:hypothetical protein
MFKTNSLVVAAVMAGAALLAQPMPAVAQDPGSRAEEHAQAQQEKARALSPEKSAWLERQLLSIERAGGFGVARGWLLTVGDIKRGSGIGLGPAYGKTFMSGVVVQAKVVYSIRNFKVAQVSLLSPPLAGDRLTFKGRVRWQDAPKLSFYGLAPGSTESRTFYSEKAAEVSSDVLFRPVRILRFGAGAGVERFDTGIAHSAVPSLSYLFDGVPGVSADPDYVHARASAAIDSRDGEGYSRRGSLLRATLHDYRQQNSGPYSFQRVDGAAEQYVPILHGNWVLYLSLRASTTSATSGHAVPFFLMPDVGGHDLRGFGNYRFRDRHSMLATAEYRWYAQEFLEGAIFFDAGKAVPERRALDFKELNSSVGVGIRLHTAQSALRLEVARGREGSRLILWFSPAGG